MDSLTCPCPESDACINCIREREWKTAASVLKAMFYKAEYNLYTYKLTIM